MDAVVVAVGADFVAAGTVLGLFGIVFMVVFDFKSNKGPVGIFHLSKVPFICPSSECLHKLS